LISEAVNPQPLTAEARVQSQFSPCETCGRPPNTAGFSCQYHFTNAPYSYSSWGHSHQH